ncbi:MAG: succinyl-diaminopimelate desuccinylase [Mariprofundaceae bacterium]|nr:succinyl-diaminopimelate desuccinylase [Mariprofundaceae bacterium]
MYKVEVIASDLIRRESVTPEDGGCQEYLESLLRPLGFVRHSVDVGGIINSIYSREGECEGVLAFAGHTDVVPTGPIEQWDFPPFSGLIQDDMLCGRGAQDMKSAIACWAVAIERLIGQEEPLPTLQMLITSDEEGDSVDGTIRMLEYLEAKQALPDAAIVGEPSSLHQVGDTVRRGRRGVVTIYVDVIGKQGHSAYPNDANNAVHHAVIAGQRVLDTHWGEPFEGFPATSCQITNFNGGAGASNVIPGEATLMIDIRYNPSINFAGIKQRVEAAFAGIKVDLDFRHQAEVFFTPDGDFLDLVTNQIKDKTGIDSNRDTGGGTSDGRFLAVAGIPVVELGLTNDRIHQINERVMLAELTTLTDIYQGIIKHF